MKTYKKRAYLCLIIFAFLSAVCLSGCTKTGGSGPVDIKEIFLTAYFTSNYEGRYDAWQEFSADADHQTEGIIEQAITQYYESVRDLVSDDFYKTMILNREIMKYDKVAYDNGINITPGGFEFAEYSVLDGKTTYSFTAHLIKKTGSGSFKGVVEGQITEERSGDTLLITNLRLSRDSIKFYN
jgi:hypothetical protein